MLATGALMSGCLLWGLAWWPLKELGGFGLSGSLLTLLAYGAASAALMPFGWRQRAIWRGRTSMLAFIFVSGGLWNLLYVAAMMAGDASRVVLLYYLSMVWSILGGWVYLREPIDARRCLCVMLALVGAIQILGASSILAGALSGADLMAIGAGVAHATTNLAFRKAHDLPVTTKNVSMFLGSVVTAAMMILATNQHETLSSLSTLAMLAGMAFGALWVLTADALTQYGVSHLPASRSAVLLLSELLVTVVSAAILASESLTTTEAIGAVLIMLASILEVRYSRSTDETPTVQHGVERKAA
jgi:drug/metabolite transporter (DMT)-like permease